MGGLLIAGLFQRCFEGCRRPGSACSCGGHKGRWLFMWVGRGRGESPEPFDRTSQFLPQDSGSMLSTSPLREARGR